MNEDKYTKLLDQNIELMKRNRDLRTEILLLAYELGSTNKEIADKLLDILERT